MTDYERGIRDAIRYRMTYLEYFSISPSERSVPFESGYHFSMMPDRVRPGELLPGSAAHRQKMIELVSDAAVKDLIQQ